MSLYKDASLVMIPSAYKDGKLYSIRPTDGSGDFTFSRGSNLAATRVDVNGLIEKGRENLLAYSNTFNNAIWSNSAVVITSGESGYDGSSDAWILKPNTSSASHFLYHNNYSNTGVNTMSAYVKYSGYHAQLRVYGIGGGRAYANFDLQNGTKGTSGGDSIIDSSITSVGKGWYRISLTLNYSSGYDAGIGPIPSPTSSEHIVFAGDGTSGNLLQDFQLEAGLVATDYIETGASTAQAGILEDMPRLDYSGGASCPALLLEPQRSNLIRHSEYLNGWNTISAITIEANTDETLSPEGKYNAYKTTAIGGSTQRIYDVVNVAAGSITMSMYVKSGTEDQIRLMTTDQTFDIYYDLTNETKTEVFGTGTIEPVGNGWYRISATGTSAGGTEVPQVRHLGTAGSSEYQYWYGIQLEQGSYPTSYIPTYGSSVTRSYDNLEGASYNDILSPAAFTLFFDFGKSEVGTGSGYIYRMDVSGTNNDLDLYQNPFGGGGLNIYLSQQGGYIFGTNGNDGWNVDASKVAISYDGDRLAYFINGSLYNSTTGISFTDADTKVFFKTTNSSPAYDLKQYTSFPTALTDSECIALTTI